MNIIDYTVVFHEQRKIFLEIVRNKISKGYVPKGGISVLKKKDILDEQKYYLHDASGCDVVFYQAMVKYEDKKTSNHKYYPEIPYTQLRGYGLSYQDAQR